MFMGGLSSQILSYLLLMPEVWQVIWRTEDSACSTLGCHGTTPPPLPCAPKSLSSRQVRVSQELSFLAGLSTPHAASFWGKNAQQRSVEHIF